MIELPNDPGKINFIVAVHVNFANVLTGGVVAMHRLAYMLAERGHNVFMFTHPEYPHPNIKVINSWKTSTHEFVEFYAWDQFSFLYKNTVVIYPQIARGNPVGAAHVVRWLLYDTEKLLEDAYGENDVYANFGNFKSYRKVEHLPLTTFNYYMDKLYITNTGKRKGFCHMYHKHTPPGGENLINQLSSMDLTGWKTLGNYDYLREHFNQYEYMLTYDQKSFYTVAAGLCGCKSIILNPGQSYEFAPNANSDSEDYKKILTPEEYRERNPIQRYGVAYGFDDIHWANTTIGQVTDHIKELERRDTETVDNFVKYWENKIFA